MPRRKRKRHSNNRLYESIKRPRHYEQQFEIVSRVQSQRGIRGHIVLVRYSANMPYNTLQAAVDSIGSKILICDVEEQEDKKKYQMWVNNELLAEGWYYTLTAAKMGLAELAIADLEKSCFTVIRKVQLRDIPKVAPSALVDASSSTPKPPEATTKVGGIGAKMMLQMGWSGGGLGAKEQGRTEIVKPYMQIHRQGLGTKNISEKVRNLLQEYAFSNDLNSLAFSSDFSKPERSLIHVVAHKFNLKSASHGQGNNRMLVIQKKLKPWDLVHSLLEIGGENEQLKLVLPTDINE